MSIYMSIGSLLFGSGTYLNASRIFITTSSHLGSSCACSFPAGGFKTQRMTKNPIMSMTRSANVKIHSGHSSHSVALHLQALVAMGLRSLGNRGLLLAAEETHELHFDDARIVARLNAQNSLEHDFLGEGFFVT